MPSKVYTGPDKDEPVVLGKTLPDLLYEAFERFPDCPRAFNQPEGEEWKAFSLDDFRAESEEIALGLRDLGLERGDHVGLFMESDVYFCLADMGCLTAGLVDVPIYLTHASESIKYVLKHSESRAVFVSDFAALERLAPILADAEEIEYVVVAAAGEEEESAAPGLPQRIGVVTLDGLRARGRKRREGDSIEKLLAVIQPGDVATVLYTSGTTGTPKGVILSHENISFNAMTAIGGLGEDYEAGPDGEVVISFLPLTHIFARALHYGFMAHASPVYFTNPDDLGEDLKKVHPTIMASVPRVLEKVYGNIQKRADTLSPVKKRLLNWALRLAESYDLNKEPSVAYRAQHALLDPLVFSKWREALGGRMRYLVVGGAALSAKLTNIFAAAGITALQGYGLTETSPIITYNRMTRNKPGTAGQPLAGVEVMIAGDGEILTRGPHIMQGYFKNEEKTREDVSDDGWFHTGDIGEFTPDGFLMITDRKKALFKLSTGKYVVPQPLESRLTGNLLIENALVVGSGRKYCTALVFPDREALGELTGTAPDDAAAKIEDPDVIARFQEMVDEANKDMDPWSTIKRFAIVPVELTSENDMLTPTMKVRRSKVEKQYQDEIDRMYAR